jgi:hypothetical protein
MTNVLINSLQNIKNSSSDNYHILFDEIIKKSINDLHEIIKTDLIKDIVPCIRGNDMYNYSELDELVTVEQIKNSTILRNLESSKDNSSTKDDIRMFSNSTDVYKSYASIEAYHKFITMKEDEKIIYTYKQPDDRRFYETEIPINAIIFLTNHAKLMCYYSNTFNEKTYNSCVMIDYNFLMPKDYINGLFISTIDTFLFYKKYKYLQIYFKSHIQIDI